jgi:cytochrome c biogenesis factor
VISLFSKPILAVVSILTATILLLAIGTTMILIIPVHNTLAAVTLGDQVQRTPIQSAIIHLNDARRALEKNNTKVGLENLILAQQQLVALEQGLAQNSTSAVMSSNEQANQSAPTITPGQSSISGQSRRCDQLKGPSSGLCQ